MPDEPHPTEVKPPSSAPHRRGDSRFTPGAMLAERFRIIALLGKGGMGEVYRAEDLKLGQQVALKFLPLTDSARLERLYSEVRLGRQVSHPNVCRLYDVMEWEGLHFISMEYIDGEDLASLLRRIGKLPPAKALDMTRELCAGLAAAHALGIIHRDLKPANVMIDGRGTARITDFGLAALGKDAQDEIAGTPAYMAPEQLAGEEVTQRSDLYALGLILYEMFTGKRVPENRSESRSHSISRETKEIDPAVQRVIIRCLEEKPASRPPSISAVIAALPGGDPLQAAIDAGETPSPEMVAAAGETGELHSGVATALLAAVILLILINAALSKTAMLWGRVALPKKPDVLVERARSILAAAGYTRPPIDVAYNLGWNNDYFESNRPPGEDYNSVRPSPVVFYYRESPRELLALQSERRVTSYDPPLTQTGMANVQTDAAGRLISFAVVPPELEAAPPQPQPVQWTRFVSEAGIDAGSLRSVGPKWRAPVDSDQKVAWEARYPEQPNTLVRVEAASHHGRPVWFAVIPPWQQADRTTYVGAPRTSKVAQIFAAVLGFFTAWGAIYLARRNLRRSRGDRKGAFRIAIFLIVVTFVMRALRVDHVWDLADENDIFTQLVSEAIVTGVVAWLVYLAIEPYFRRRWPRLLIAWTRLLSGRFRDPMVGRDVLIGAAAGCFCSVVMKVGIVAPTWFGRPPLEPIRTYFTALTELRHVGFLLLNNFQPAVLGTLGAAFLYLLFHIITRNAIAATILLFAALTMFNVTAGPPWPVALVMSVIAVFLFRRYGLISLAAFWTFAFIVAAAPVTLDTSAWYFGRSLFVMALLTAIAGYACWIALAAPIFNLAILEED